jgi:uncharacterized membrane-anchored protein
MFKWLVAAFAALLFHVQAVAAEPELTPQEKAEVARLIELRDSLKPQHGVIALPAAKARLNLGKGYYFLGPADARRVLTEGWGNPPEIADGVLGLVFPEGKTFLDDSWGAVVTYEGTGYVTDSDAKSADYAGLLEQMRSGEAEANEERKKTGYSPIHLVGWAQAPAYDAARHDLIWARELQFGNDADHTLNYDVRHLGREGVLSLNMVSVMSHLDAVRAGAQDLAKTAEFDSGKRYADFRDGDKAAGFGLAGLVAAGAGLAAAKKVGLIAILLAFAKKGFALLAIAGAAAFGWVRKLFGGKPKPAASVVVAEDPPAPEDAPDEEGPGKNA